MKQTMMIYHIILKMILLKKDLKNGIEPFRKI